MGAPMKCLKCDSRWYGMGGNRCHDCGSEDVDVDAPPLEPDARMLAMVELVRLERKISDADERLHEFMDDRGGGVDTYNLCLQFGLVRDDYDFNLECGAIVIAEPASTPNSAGGRDGR